MYIDMYFVLAAIFRLMGSGLKWSSNHLWNRTFLLLFCSSLYDSFFPLFLGFNTLSVIFRFNDLIFNFAEIFVSKRVNSFCTNFLSSGLFFHVKFLFLSRHLLMVWRSSTKENIITLFYSSMLFCSRFNDICLDTVLTMNSTNLDVILNSDSWFIWAVASYFKWYLFSYK